MPMFCLRRRLSWSLAVASWAGLAGYVQGASNAGPSESDRLFASQQIPHLRIEIPPEGMEILRHYQFDINDLMERTNVLATVREGKTVYTNVAVHIKGHLGSFQPVDSKPALTLNFDKVAKGQRFHGLQKISLNNSVQDSSYVSEQISRELFLAAGIPTPRAAHATADLNGRALGLFVLLEGWNKQFLKQHFRNPNGNLYDGGIGRDITWLMDASGDHPDGRTLVDILIGSCGETNPVIRLAEIKQVLDYDRYMTFFAMEVLTAHWDGYTLNRNNFRVYEDPEIQKLVFLPHGMDQMFGVWRMRPTSSITPMMRGIVSDAIMRTAEGRLNFIERLSYLATNVVNVAKLCARVDEISAKIQPALEQDPSALQSQQQSAAQLRSRIIARVASVREQLPTANEPVHFDAAGSFPLSGWEFKRDSGSPSFSRLQNGHELQVSAANRLAYGSWRTTVRLGDGSYELIGRLKLQDFGTGPGVKNPGATVRISGERFARMTTNAPDWTTVRYDFTNSGVADLEVVCEFRGFKGRVIFDADSLRVVRKANH